MEKWGVKRVGGGKVGRGGKEKWEGGKDGGREGGKGGGRKEMFEKRIKC